MNTNSTMENKIAKRVCIGARDIAFLVIPSLLIFFLYRTLPMPTLSPLLLLKIGLVLVCLGAALSVLPQINFGIKRSTSEDEGISFEDSAKQES